MFGWLLPTYITIVSVDKVMAWMAKCKKRAFISLLYVLVDLVAWKGRKFDRQKKKFETVLLAGLNPRNTHVENTFLSNKNIIM